MEPPSASFAEVAVQTCSFGTACLKIAAERKALALILGWCLFKSFTPGCRWSECCKLYKSWDKHSSSKLRLKPLILLQWLANIMTVLCFLSRLQQLGRHFHKSKWLLKWSIQWCFLSIWFSPLVSLNKAKASSMACLSSHQHAWEQGVQTHGLCTVSA